MSEEKQPRKASSVRHTRVIQRDRTKHSITAPSAKEIQEHLTEIVYPATLAQVDYFRKLGLRERTLVKQGIDLSPSLVMFIWALGRSWFGQLEEATLLLNEAEKSIRLKYIVKGNCSV